MQEPAGLPLQVSLGVLRGAHASRRAEALRRLALGPRAVPEEVDTTGPVELVLLAVKDRAARCYLLETGKTITLRATGIWRAAPGQVLTLRADKCWRWSGHPYISGEIERVRTDAAALKLTPLKLNEKGVWDPKEHEWGEEGELLEDWARPIVAWGPRPMFEMEQILPGSDPADFASGSRAAHSGP